MPHARARPVSILKIACCLTDIQMQLGVLYLLSLATFTGHLRASFLSSTSA